MRLNTMINQLDAKRVEAAIAEAEQRTSGEIRISISPFFWGNVHRTAERAFERLGMTATQERNGVLIFIVPARRKFVILGDAGIHEKVGQEFWEKVREAMTGHFRSGEFTEGLVNGIRMAGEQLATHFPSAGPRDQNELPDQIDYGG